MERLNKKLKRGFLFLAVLFAVWAGISSESLAKKAADGEAKAPDMGSLIVQKLLPPAKEEEPPSPCEGVVYRITLKNTDGPAAQAVSDEDTQDTQTWVEKTNAEGNAIFQNLPFGRYIVEEESGTPEGYLKGESFEISIPFINETEMEYEGKVYAPGELCMYDVTAVAKTEPIIGAVRIVKKDDTDQSLLKGAVFQLYKENGEVFTTDSGQPVEVVTGDDGTAAVYHLPYGKYYFVETLAPEGYLLSDKKIPFEISLPYNEEDGSGLVELVVTNLRKPSSDETEDPHGNDPRPPQTEPPTETEIPDITVTPHEKKSTPIKTGDATQAVLWLDLMAASAAALLLAARRRKK